MTIDQLDRRWLAYARDVVEHVVRRTSLTPPPPDCPTPPAFGGVFVTLRKFGALRGCIGTLDATFTFSEALCSAARKAATQDTRFPPVTPRELPDLRVCISVLTPLRRMNDAREIQLGQTGVCVQFGESRGLFLPEVGLRFASVEEFLSRCCSEKAEQPATAWREPHAQVWLFESLSLREPD